MKKLLENHPLFEYWFSQISGIGVTMSAKFISFNLDPNRHISSWYAYFGLVPFFFKCKCENGHKFLSPKVPNQCKVLVDNERCNGSIIEIEKVEQGARKIAGYRNFWNSQAKTWAYNQFNSFLKTKSYYRMMAYAYMIQELEKHLRGQTRLYNKLHLYLRGMRKTIKLFLSHTHEVTRELLGIPKEKPYQFEFLQHDDYISPEEVLNLDKKTLETKIKYYKQELEKLKQQVFGKAGKGDVEVTEDE